MKIEQLNQKKSIALIAHDSRKKDMIKWVRNNMDKLKQHSFYGTGTTAKMIAEETGLTVTGFNSGPLGGDQQIGSKIVEGEINFMIFFWDPMSTHPHDPDVKALLRIATLYNIPMATNISSADFMINSFYFDQSYDKKVFDYSEYLSRDV